MIRYAFPVEHRGDPETVAILLVRDVRRDALEVQGIYDRFGGLAVVAHGHPRTTGDVDILAALDRANLRRLAAAFRELEARLSGVDAHLLGIDVYDPACSGMARTSRSRQPRADWTSSARFPAGHRTPI